MKQSTRNVKAPRCLTSHELARAAGGISVNLPPPLPTLNFIGSIVVEVSVGQP
jgi:hypothetical protein